MADAGGVPYGIAMPARLSVSDIQDGMWREAFLKTLAPRKRRRFIKELERSIRRHERQLPLLEPADRAIAEKAMAAMRVHVAAARKMKP